MTDQLDMRLNMERLAIRRSFLAARQHVRAWTPRPHPLRKDRT